MTKRCAYGQYDEKETHLQELLSGWDEARVAHYWLQDNASNLALVGLEDGPHGLQVVVAGCQCGSCKGNTTFSVSATTLLRSLLRILNFILLAARILCTH